MYKWMVKGLEWLAKSLNGAGASLLEGRERPKSLRGALMQVHSDQTGAMSVQTVVVAIITLIVLVNIIVNLWPTATADIATATGEGGALESDAGAPMLDLIATLGLMLMAAGAVVWMVRKFLGNKLG